MMQTELLTKRPVSAVGEEIPHELGAKMIRDYQKSNPNDANFYIIGKDVINRILAQPECSGIKFFEATNENGEKTLVYVGLTMDAKPILQYSIVNNEGVLEEHKGIVADRLERGGSPAGTGIGADDWNWNVD